MKSYLICSCKRHLEENWQMSKFKAIGGLAIFLVVLLVALAIYNNTNEFIEKQLYGSEYCFSELSQSEIGLATQGIEIKYTRTEGNQLCFRTKDTSIVEKLNKQIQYRKLQESLAKIESSDRFWNHTFLIIVVVIVLGIVIIAIIYSLSGGSSYY